MSDIAIKIEHVSKEYRLGAIGGGTLRGDLQSWWARVRGKEDPNLKLDQTTGRKGDRFLALDDVSFEVKKGEAVGIIGHNGAGKSTLLKLLSRVTAPTKGSISYNGRIASMLEVGTGFHPELTGRENVYMNGAILGMSKAEIDKKFDEIVAFAEMEKFIDTPVKRYSSGMYVKLAFSVAAHLDSEIMIMDEVLAVGDMKFQQKCLGKMGDAANNEGRTVLYVSHNMNTIRQLCTRCVVLDHGRVIFDGDVEQAIEIYLGHHRQMSMNDIIVDDGQRYGFFVNPEIKITRLLFENPTGVYQYGSNVHFKMYIQNLLSQAKDLNVRIVVNSSSGVAVTMSTTKDPFFLKGGEDTCKHFILNTSTLVPGTYTLAFVLMENGTMGAEKKYETLQDIYTFSVTASPGFNHDTEWQSKWWGFVCNGYLEEQ